MDLRHLPIQLRAASEDDGEPEGVLIGYASVYDVEYRIGNARKESIRKGAFDESIKAQNGVIPVFYAHDWAAQKSAVPQPPIGVGYVSSDKTGVKVRAELFMDDSKARNVWLAAKAGALREWSIGYTVSAWEADENDDDLEHVTKGELLEASVVLRGANPATSMIEVRSAPEEDEQEREPTILDEAWSLLANPAFRASIMVQWDGTPTDDGNKE